MAKVKFENKLLTGNISVTLKGSDKKWQARKENVISYCIQVVDKYQQINQRLTLRQLYYQLVAADLIPNHDTVYKKISKILSDARLAGVIDWDMIEDRVRRPKVPTCFDSPKDAIEVIIQAYRVNRQTGQSKYIEVWTEKDAISGIIEDITNHYGIPLVVNRGYGGWSAFYRAYEDRMSQRIKNGDMVKILYLGDHDPSGLDMIADINTRMKKLFSNSQKLNGAYYSDSFDIEPVALTMKQIEQYNPPPNPAKLTDTRAAAYVKKYGAKSWEVDALPPDVLAQVLRTAIEKEIDTEIFDSMMMREKSEKQTLSDSIDKN